MLEAQRRRTRSHRVSSEYAWHSDGQPLCRPQTSSVACSDGRYDENEIRWCLSVQMKSGGKESTPYFVVLRAKFPHD